METTELTVLGESAVSAWAARDRRREHRLAVSATMLANAESAVEASGLFPALASALGEALREFEHGSVAVLMCLTPLAADAGRRILESVYYTVFLRQGPIALRKRSVTLASWHGGDALYSFRGPLEEWARRRPRSAAGPYGKRKVMELYGGLSSRVHTRPASWGEARRGLALVPPAAEVERNERWLTAAAKAVVYAAFTELPDLWVDEADRWYGAEWSSVRKALGLP